ncbi:MAG: glutamate 5-kinase [Gammaproteobacteria bacterium]|nr:MAG: glutamate 5-kinase [Gammaproteobacteria bacterium]
MKIWIIKIGSSLIAKADLPINIKNIQKWAGQIDKLRDYGISVVLVSSGAISAGVQKLNWQKRPHRVHKLQAAAAVGQTALIQNYESVFYDKYKIRTAQILLTHQDLSNRKSYLNAKRTIQTLLDFNVMPIINENDTVATSEIRFGDNDTLAALSANLLQAEKLIIMTDQDGLFDDNPQNNPNAKLIKTADANDKNLLKYATGRGSEFSTGGMMTKITAATKAANSGCMTIICNGNNETALLDIYNNKQVGTTLKADKKQKNAFKVFIKNNLKAQGKIILDSGAIEVITKSGKSLLPVGVLQATGDFQRGDLVVCCDEKNTEIACGLINYNIDDTRKIIGRISSEIEKHLGYIAENELIHRDNMSLI